MMALMIIIALCNLVTLVTAGHIGHCQGQGPQQ